MAAKEDFEVSKPNPSLVEEILKDSATSSWEWNVDLDQPYALKEVVEDSVEYTRVKNLFSLTSRGMTIRKIERVENPYLLGHYLLKKEKVSPSGVRRVSLFHGTHEKFVEGICKFNFDWRKCGSSRGHKFGRGVSFTPEVSYARHYTPYGENVIILAKVLLGRGSYGNSSTVLPLANSDTTMNIKKTVFVKYEDDDFYPQYVVHFNRW